MHAHSSPKRMAKRQLQKAEDSSWSLYEAWGRTQSFWVYIGLTQSRGYSVYRYQNRRPMTRITCSSGGIQKSEYSQIKESLCYRDQPRGQWVHLRTPLPPWGHISCPSTLDWYLPGIHWSGHTGYLWPVSSLTLVAKYYYFQYCFYPYPIFSEIVEGKS